MPIDMTALSYHWSVLKIVRLTFFFSGRARVFSGLGRESDCLALVDLEVVFFAIFITRIIPTSILHLSRCGVTVTGGSGGGLPACAVHALRYSFIYQRLRAKLVGWSRPSDVMTQDLRNFGVDSPFNRKKAVERGRAISLWLFGVGRIRAKWQTTGEPRNEFA